MGRNFAWFSIKTKKRLPNRYSSHCLFGGVWFVVRTQCGTTCLFTNVSCVWRTLKGPYGQWTRWSSTRGDRRGAHRVLWPNQSSGTSTLAPHLNLFFIFVYCVFCDFYNLFLISFYIFLYIFIYIYYISLLITLCGLCGGKRAWGARVFFLAGSVTACQAAGLGD